MRKIVEGWLGGVYDDFGIYDNLEDAETGIMPRKTIEEAFDEFKGEKVRITVEVIK